MKMYIQKRILSFLLLLFFNSLTFTRSTNQWKQKATQAFATAIALSTKLPLIATRAKLLCSRTTVQQCIKGIDKVSSNYLQLRRFAPYLYRKNPFCVPVAKKSSFIIPASGSISTDTLLTGAAIPIGLGITYATWKATQHYKAKKELRASEHTPQTYCDLAKLQEQALYELRDEHEKKQEQSWWEKHQQDVFFLSTILFACKSAYKAIQKKFYPNYLEHLIDYCNDPHHKDFGQNDLERYHFNTTQNDDQTLHEHQTRIHVPNSESQTPFDIVAHYAWQQDKTPTPFLITCTRQHQRTLPQEDNVALNFALDLQKKYHTASQNNSNINADYFYTQIKTPTYGTYHALLRNNSDQFKADCYHDRAYQQNIDSVQQRKTWSDMQHSHTKPPSVENIAYLIQD